jgi:hypothetical protein
MTGWTVTVAIRLLGDHGYAKLMPFDVAIADKAKALNAVLAMFPPDGIQSHTVEALSEAEVAELGLTAGEVRQQ